MRKTLAIILAVVLLVPVLGGCTAVEKVNKAASESQIRTAKANQQVLRYSIGNQYAMTGEFPKDVQQIEKGLTKPLSELNLSVKFNEDGSITISNTDGRVSKEEVPDIVISKDNI